MTYNFYIQNEGQIYGPYTAVEIQGLGLLDDTPITESNLLNGEWCLFKDIDFWDDIIMKELGSDIGAGGEITIPNDHIPVETPNLSQWNWGAFGTGWLWGVFNGVYWPLLLILLAFVPYAGPILNLVARIFLGIHGSKWAWEGKNWLSAARFNEVQHRWNVAGVVIFVVGIIIGIVRICYVFAYL